MKKLILFLVFCATTIAAQDSSVSTSLAKTIESATLKEHVYILAADELEGRETGTEGNLKAAKYIADQFASYGIPPLKENGTYFQEVDFTVFKWEDISLTISGKEAEQINEFFALPQKFPKMDETLNIQSMMFLGYGINDPAYSDYQGVNVRGKHLLVYGGEPRYEDETFRISGTNKPSDWSFTLSRKVEAAKEAGAASIWIIQERFQAMANFAQRRLLNGSVQMGAADQINAYVPHAIISPTIGKEITGKNVNKIIKLRNKITKKGKPQHTKIQVDIQFLAKHDIQSTPSVNVLGYIEGTDPLLKNEVLVISAHFDHLGKRGNDIYNGADDNASGTSGVLEIAQAFSIAKKQGHGPKRSVLCLLVTAEEKGLLGSQYYVEHPVFPLENTIADVNIDMIGRMDKLHTDSNYVYVIGSDRLSTELHEINEEVNKQFTKIDLDYTYNDKNDRNRYYERSDHYNFAKNGIPAIFYFAGTHPDYHRSTDTPDKIMYERAASIAKLAFHTAWEIANRKDRIKVDVISTDKS